MRAFPWLTLFFVLSSSVFAKQVEVTVLATTDLHGNIYPYDYLTGQPVDRGFAKLATLINQERRAAPQAMLIDCGDTIQGTPLESVYQTYVRTGKFPRGLQPLAPLRADPMMLVMNRLGYDGMVVGNHEFNFGLENMQKARQDAKFPWISANANVGEGSPQKPFAPYLLKVVEGVKVAVIGLTTPAVPSWEKPENYKAYRFANAVQSLRQTLAGLEQHKPDLVIVAAHAGLDRDVKTGAIRQGDLQGENMVYQIASEVKGVDAIVFGHTHQELPSYRIGDVLLTQPKNWGISLARLKFTLSDESGKYKVISKSSSLVPVIASTEADPDVLRIAKPYHDLTEAYLTSKVTEAPAAIDAGDSRIKDTAIIDAIQRVQKYYGKADVSFSASFNPRARIPKGPVTIRQIASLYIYDNELYTIQGNGKMVKDALENAAKFYNTCPDPACSTGPLINRSVIPYNYDMADGVTYDIDLTQPVGQRIRNLRFKGEPLKDTLPLRIALNNYRAGGSGGYTSFKGAPLLWRSYDDMRELIIRYYSEHPLPGQPDNNWKIVPENANTVLAAESKAEASRPRTQ